MMKSRFVILLVFLPFFLLAQTKPALRIFPSSTNRTVVYWTNAPGFSAQYSVDGSNWVNFGNQTVIGTNADLGPLRGNYYSEISSVVSISVRLQ